MATQIGGKSAKPKKSPMPALLVLSMSGPKDEKGEPTHASNGGPLPDKVDDKYAGKGPGGKTIQPGEAGFTDQTKTCSHCSYFSPEGNDGVGECKMGVPEADFTLSDPDASQCKFFESADEEKSETPEEEANEDESQEVPNA